MFETAELGHKVPGKTFKKTVPVLRQELLELQQQLLELDHSQVILYFAGVDKAGKGETINLLNEWMDARWLQTRAFAQVADLELERPEYWRYWLSMPPRGRIGMFLSAWYSPVVLDRVHERIGGDQFEHRLERITSFEHALVEDGAVIVKLWLHLSRDAQERRLKSLESDPLSKDRVTDRDWEHWNLYDRFIETAERVIARTNTGRAPWHIVEGEDPRHRALSVGAIVRDALRRAVENLQLDARLRTTSPPPVKSTTGAAEEASASPPKQAPVTVLSHLDMSLTLEKDTYRKQLATLQSKLVVLHRQALAQGRSSLLVFEGPDAAGKGGAIRRVTAALDPRIYQVHGVAAPTDEERAQHYLWRFWRRLPRAGHMAIYDRSWYGRVLVERVKGFAREDEWRRAYQEINEFEAQLSEHGIVLAKFWVHISKEEQLARFRLREETPYKRWKLTDEDWRNRERWDEYEAAVHDMVQYTSTPAAPWTLVEGNDKRFSRIKVLETVCARLEAALGTSAS